MSKQVTVKPTGDTGSTATEQAAAMHQRRAEMIDYKATRSADRRAARKAKRG